MSAEGLFLIAIVITSILPISFLFWISRAQKITQVVGIYKAKWKSIFLSWVPFGFFIALIIYWYSSQSGFELVLFPIAIVVLPALATLYVYLAALIAKAKCG